MENSTPVIRRALMTTEEERFIREFILQWKLGKVNREYFEKKFEVDLKNVTDSFFRAGKKWVI